jgi:hypothetical protein
LVRCTSGEPTLREYFVRAVELAVRQLGDSPTRPAVNQAIKRLVDLFQAFEAPARRTVQGLWAELFVIDASRDPGALLSAWHIDREEAFDFAVGPDRLEVKSFSGPARVHTFALRQVRPGVGISVLVASVRAERSAGGSSVADLMRSITQRGIGDEAVAKMEAIVAATLGNSAPTALGLLFDVERARESLRFFDAQGIPSVDPVLPAGVIGVHFESSLEGVASLPTDGLAARGPLAAAAAPRA